MSYHILLCDDELHILRAAEFKLSKAGFRVQCANDGQEAWEAILQKCPDLLVTDLQMPRLNGFELTQKIRDDQRFRHLPILMLTAKGYEFALEESARRYGVLTVLHKPFSPRELLQWVQTTLERRESGTSSDATGAQSTPTSTVLGDLVPSIGQ